MACVCLAAAVPLPITLGRYRCRCWHALHKECWLHGALLDACGQLAVTKPSHSWGLARSSRLTVFTAALSHAADSHAASAMLNDRRCWRRDWLTDGALPC